MSINFYKTILLVVFCLSFLSPIKLQAYCQFEGCGDSSNVDEAPLTLQEAQDIKEFYTDFERSLSENVEVLSDGTYQVTFNQNIAMGMGMGLAANQLRPGVEPPRSFDKVNRNWWIRQGKRWDEGYDLLNSLAKEYPHEVSVVAESKDFSIFTFHSPRDDYKIQIEHFRRYRKDVTTRVIYYKKENYRWIRARRTTPIDIMAKGTVSNKLNALKSVNPMLWESYLYGARVKFGGVARRAVRAVRFVGRWSLRAVLAGASIVGGQLLFDYAQENHPEETGLVIAITKEQFEILSTNVRGIIEELSENNDLNELEL